MQNFAFMIHPMHAGDVARKFKFARFVPERAIEKAFSLLPSMKVSHITGFALPTGRPRAGLSPVLDGPAVDEPSPGIRSQ